MRSLLHAIVAERLETFLAGARGRGRSTPRFVEREFRRFLECGVLMVMTPIARSVRREPMTKPQYDLCAELT